MKIQSIPGRSDELRPEVIQALNQLKFTTLTPIQEKAVPVALAGRDILGCAQTGSGKTAAFLIPIFQQLLVNANQNALILAPTRELILQICDFWKLLTRAHPRLTATPIMGGMDMGRQIRNLSKNPRIIFATPGRLADHLNRRSVNLNRITILVLDEADRMLDMGFAPQLNLIAGALPKKRQTLFFTATWDKKLDQLAKKYLTSPDRITVGEATRAAPEITQKVIETSVKEKNNTLLDAINAREGTLLIFARTKHRTDRVAKFLNSYGLEVARIHGGRTQGQRNAALLAFKEKKVRILVATDIASRGIDVQNIAHVINYDLPQSAEDYVHRIGRTGRAGAKGEAVSFVTPEDKRSWLDIQKTIKSAH